MTPDPATEPDARHALADVTAITARGHRPVVVGGSGLYVRALLDRLEFPGTDADVRARLEERAEQHGTRHLHDELAHLWRLISCDWLDSDLDELPDHPRYDAMTVDQAQNEAAARTVQRLTEQIDGYVNGRHGMERAA